MPETAAITPVHHELRVAADVNSETAPQEQTGPDAAAGDRQNVAAPRAQEAALASVPDATPRSDAAPAEVAAPAGSTPAAAEIELKLLVDADRLAEFNDAPVITAHARSKGTRKHLKAVYYDTPERALRDSRLSLRVRQSGARFVQTVKADAGDDPLRRGEWEASVSSLAPDIALAAPFIPEKLRADLEQGGLEAVFTSDVHRTVRVIELPSGTVEVAFDHGILKAGNHSLPVSEIELELKDGSASAIYDLALRLAEHGPVTPSIRSKSARGFDLAAGTPPTVRKPQKLRLDPSTCLDDAFASILRACLYHLLQSLPAAEDGRDPEGIHQLRVALRRLRTVFDLMRSVGTLSRLELFVAEARWLATNLSAAREWDIFQASTLPTIAKSCPSIAGFDALDEVAETRRTEAYRRVRSMLAEPRCARFLIGLGGWIETRGWRSDIAAQGLGQLTLPASDFARRMLSLQHAKVLKRGRHFKSLEPDGRHRLRLAAKKMRYVADFLLPLCGNRKSAKRFSGRLAALQEELGCYNDMATTAALLAGPETVPAESAQAAAAITGWQAHAMASVEARLRDTWRDYVKVELPWLDQQQA